MTNGFEYLIKHYDNKMFCIASPKGSLKQFLTISTCVVCNLMYKLLLLIHNHAYLNFVW